MALFRSLKVGFPAIELSVILVIYIWSWQRVEKLKYMQVQVDEQKRWTNRGGENYYLQFSLLGLPACFLQHLNHSIMYLGLFFFFFLTCIGFSHDGLIHSPNCLYHGITIQFRGQCRKHLFIDTSSTTFLSNKQPMKYGLGPRNNIWCHSFM